MHWTTKKRLYEIHTHEGSTIKTFCFSTVFVKIIR